jgi:hypothetical protein
MTNETEALRTQRASTHGDFAIGATLAVNIMELIHAAPNWQKLNPVQKESLHMIVHKVQRLMTGDPNEDDHWNDIAGYAHLPIAKKEAMAKYMANPKVTLAEAVQILIKDGTIPKGHLGVSGAA